MVTVSKKSNATSKLPRRAETGLNKARRKAGESPVDRAQKSAQELAVYQIELERQNEELLRTQDELERMRDQYTELYDFAPVSYLTLDREGTIRTANLAVSKLFELERSHLIGRGLTQFIAAEDRSAFSIFLQKVFSLQDKESCDVWLFTKDQPKRYVQIEGVADSSGEVCRVVIFDMTIHRQFEESHVQYSDLVARASDLEAFNYAVSHDLRTPLTIISGYSELLQKLCHNKIDDECQGFLHEISESALRMGHLIQTLLKFSHLSHREIQRKDVNLSQAAEQVMTELRQLEPQRHIKLTITQGMHVNCDPGLLNIILENLLGNAWKYTAQVQQAMIEVGEKTIGDKQVFFVNDNGSGFDAAYAEKLFLPFQRFSKTNSGGYGIGLATAARVVQCHGGKIWADSKPDKGATFFFTLE